MGRLISIHSFRHATGRSTLAANLGWLLAQRGQRVCLVDTSFQSPSLYLILGLAEDQMRCTLNRLLWQECSTHLAIEDLSERQTVQPPGALLLLPASSDVNDILRMLRHSYDHDRLSDLLCQLENDYHLDAIILDNSEGLDQDTLLSMAVASDILFVLHPSPVDFQGTAVLVEVARRLDSADLMLVLNDTPDDLDLEQAQAELEHTYICPVGGMLPHSEIVMSLASSDLAVHHYPDDPYSVAVASLADRLNI